MVSQSHYQVALDIVVKLHESDPSTTVEDGVETATELLYSNRMLQLLEQFTVPASTNLKLAVQCQHLKRWMVPRTLYAMDRKGYHQWRKAVMEYQLAETKDVLQRAGIEADDVQHICDMLAKQGNKNHTDAQIILDTACLVFVKWYLEPFAAKHAAEKVSDILAKTKRKMSEKAINDLQLLHLPAAVVNMLRTI